MKKKLVSFALAALLLWRFAGPQAQQQKALSHRGSSSWRAVVGGR